MTLVEMRNEKNQRIAVTDSKTVAEKFGKEHKNVIQSIEEILTSAEKSANLFLKSTMPDSYGRQQKVYIMNRDGFSLLVMGFTGKKALEWKLKYIQEFNKMEKQIQKLMQERIKGIGIRNTLTDSINKLPESRSKVFMYSNYTNLIYKTLFNKSANQLKEEYHVSKDKNLRDYIGMEELQKVQKLENLVASLINIDWNYHQIKEFLEQQNINQITV